MTNEELNQKIDELENNKPGFIAFGGKVIPYIGWYWRTVNFDSKDYWFGVIPTSKNPDGKPLVGFMENNKWDFDTIYCPSDKWKEIVNLIKIAVENQTFDNFKAVNDKIQALLEDKK